MATMDKIQIGDVGVVCENPPAGNPYRGERLTGSQRKLALAAFKLFGAAVGFELWFMPAAGGARKIQPDEVDWEKSGVYTR